MATRLEDPATQRLVDLLQDPAVLRVFLLFLTGDSGKTERLLSHDLKAVTQYSFTNSRLDVLIRADRIAIIIECKVHDRASVNKLEKYHREWLRTHNFAPTIYWLVRRRTENLGTNRYLQREVTWNELDAFLERIRCEALRQQSRTKLAEFRQHLRKNGILVAGNENPIRRARGRGYDYAFAEGLLQQIVDRLVDVEAEVIPPDEVKHHRLFIGRKQWSEKFADGWVKRVVLRFKPVLGSEARFTLSGAILFWNRTYVPDPTFAIREFPTWADICHSMGMCIWRNRGPKWPGKHGYQLQPPFEIARPVKYFGADQLVPETGLPVYDTSRVADAVKEGCRVIRRHFAIVDQF